jgi:hypothetical protein
MDHLDADKSNATDRGWIREARPGRNGDNVMLVLEDGSIAWVRGDFCRHMADTPVMSGETSPPTPVPPAAP